MVKITVVIPTVIIHTENPLPGVDNLHTILIDYEEILRRNKFEMTETERQREKSKLFKGQISSPLKNEC